jgi:hypothetical protein
MQNNSSILIGKGKTLEGDNTSTSNNIIRRSIQGTNIRAASGAGQAAPSSNVVNNPTANF